MMLVWTDTYFGYPWHRESQRAAKGCKRLRRVEISVVGIESGAGRDDAMFRGYTTVAYPFLRVAQGSVDPVSRQAPLRR